MFNLSFIENILKNIKINYFNRDNHLLDDYFDFFVYYSSYCNKEKKFKILYLKDIFLIQKYYINAFFNMKNGNFYEAWCLLEKVEKRYEKLINRKQNILEKYNINFIKEYVPKFQKLFPYKLFFSPEFTYKKFRCNICGQEYNLKKKCNHEIGEFYDGKECKRLIEELDLNSISLVRNPTQKYSVVFNKDNDEYDYTIIEKLFKHLESPFQRWEYKE